MSSSSPPLSTSVIELPDERVVAVAAVEGHRAGAGVPRTSLPVPPLTVAVPGAGDGDRSRCPRRRIEVSPAPVP